MTIATLRTITLLIMGALILARDLQLCAMAQTLPLDTHTEPRIEKVVMQDSYYFVSRRYTPSLSVKVISHTAARYDTPEDAAVALISAMVAGDFTWWRSIWDQTSNVLMDRRDKELHQTPDFWTSKWRANLGGKTPYLDARVQTGQYVIVAYRWANGAQRSKDDLDFITTFKQQENGWFATQELADDPVFLYWDNPNVKVERVLRQPPKDIHIPQPTSK